MISGKVRKVINEAIATKTSVLITYRKEEDRSIIARKIDPYEIKIENRLRDKSNHVYIYAVDKIEPLKIKKFLAKNFISIKSTEEKFSPIF